MGDSNKNILFEEFDIERFGLFCFFTGIFFLASAVGVSIIFLLISVFIAFLKQKNFYKTCKRLLKTYFLSIFLASFSIKIGMLFLIG